MYPLKFQPIFQNRLWGGQRLRTVLAKPTGNGSANQTIGESWEIADLPPGTVKADSSGAAADGSFSNVVANGPLAGKTLRQVMSNSDCKIQAAPNGHFPLLVKILDAQQDLSVQVHPDAAYCQNHPGAHLKSEAWYILHSEPGAKIYKGVKPGTTKEQFRDALTAGQVEPLLNAIKVLPGDCHYLPSGTVHALGAGILAAEIQTPSDTTFRVFDWNRLSADGKPRQLHINEALECIDFGIAPPPATRAMPAARNSLRMAESPFFVLDRRTFFVGQPEPLAEDVTRVWTILGGQAVITCDLPGPAANTAMTRGDVLLLPANMKNPMLRTIASLTVLEARLPTS